MVVSNPCTALLIPKDGEEELFVSFSTVVGLKVLLLLIKLVGLIRYPFHMYAPAGPVIRVTEFICGTTYIFNRNKIINQYLLWLFPILVLHY